MTITGSGQISLNDLNVEFGRTGTASLSLSESFAGTYAQYGAINRNGAPGQTVFNQYNGGTDFGFNIFYDYNDLENNYWDYVFTNNATDNIGQIKIYIGATQIYGYSDLTGGGGVDQSGGFIDTTTTANTGASLILEINKKNSVNFVDVVVVDPDTSATIYDSYGDDPDSYLSGVTLATLYGYQRMQWTMTFYD
jgi:hypothetical protein